MNTETKVKAWKAPWSFADEIHLAILHFDYQHQKCFIGELVMKEFAETIVPAPTLVMNTHQGQILMDMLWECGLRPSQGSGSAGSLAATEKHLADMRELVFKFIAPLAAPDFQAPKHT